ncbi:MAG: hypothetical protein V1779_16650 [bacterium]
MNSEKCRMMRENTNINMMVDEMELNNDSTEEELLKRIKELEKMLNRMDMEIEFKEKVIEIFSEMQKKDKV